MKAVMVKQGEVAVGRRGDKLSTYLGSCIGVILTDAKHEVAAICHILIASGGRDPGDCRYGEAAIARMEAMLAAEGVPKGARLEAFVYGGGNMYPQLVKRTNHPGAENAAWVLGRLREKKYEVRASQVEGNVYRTVDWVVGEGDPVVVAVSTEPAKA
jgi:chemotaxis protein CheD